MVGVNIYIAGPMTGVEDFNYPLFNKTAETLRSQGFTVFNPAETESENTDYPYQQAPWDWYLRRAIRKLTHCDLIVLLPGYENSKGASLELSIALSLGIGQTTLEEFLGVEQ